MSDAKDEAASTATEEAQPSPPSLPSLLSALAGGVRASNALPLSFKATRKNRRKRWKAKASPAGGARGKKKRNNDDSSSSDDSSDNDDDDDDDEYAYEMAFPEYRKLHDKCVKTLVKSIVRPTTRRVKKTILDGDGNNNDNDIMMGRRRGVEDAEDNDDDDGGDEDGGGATTVAAVWEESWNDVSEKLLDRVERHVTFMKGGGEIATAIMEGNNLWKNNNDKGGHRKKGGGGFRDMADKLADIEKSQITYGFADTINNSRTEPFVPKLPLIPKPFSLDDGNDDGDVPKPIPGHGLENVGSKNREVIAPPMHYPHPYQKELDQLVYHPFQFEPPAGVRTWNDLPSSGISGTLRGNNNNDVKTSTDQKTTTNEDGDVSNMSMEGSYTWIDTEEALESWTFEVTRRNVRELAVDLEAHNYRSFSGFLCLMQFSVRWPSSSSSSGKKGEGKNDNDPPPPCRDVLVDALVLRHCLAKYLAPLLANPSIVKVMHGAQSDIIWLQRDFGLYIVNLFDTYHASHVLSYPHHGLAYLLKRFAGVDVDKRYQLADWRVRPLPTKMVEYARSDTHYLLDVYDALRKDIVEMGKEGKGNKKGEDDDTTITEGDRIVMAMTKTTKKDDVAVKTSSSNADDKDKEEKDKVRPASIRAVLDKSRKVCLQRCQKEPFYPRGWERLLSPRGKNKAVQQRGNTAEGEPKTYPGWNAQQIHCMSSLWDWRDDTARMRDESLPYVCPNGGLVRVAKRLPATLDALRNTLHPLPPVVAEEVDVVLRFIRDARKVPLSSPPSVGNVAPQSIGAGRPTKAGGGMTSTVHHQSPLSQLTKQTTTTPPISMDVDGASSDSESSSGEGDEGDRPRKRARTGNLLTLDVSNTDFNCTAPTSHSLAIIGDGGEQTPGKGDEGGRLLMCTTKTSSFPGLADAMRDKTYSESDFGVRMKDLVAAAAGTKDDGAATITAEEETAWKTTFRVWKSLQVSANLMQLIAPARRTRSDDPTNVATMATPSQDVDANASASKRKRDGDTEGNSRGQDDRDEDNFPKPIREKYGGRANNRNSGSSNETAGTTGDRADETKVLTRKEDTDDGGKKSPRKKKQTSPSSGCRGTLTPFDYSTAATVGVLPGASGPAMGKNPFFTGAALAGVSNDGSKSRKAGNKKTGGKGAGDGKKKMIGSDLNAANKSPSERAPKFDKSQASGKVHVYRSSGR